MTNEIIVKENPLVITPSQEKLLEVLWPDLHPDHRRIGMLLANKYRLDPFAGHLNVRFDKGKLSAKPSRDGWIAIAKYNGYRCTAEVFRAGDQFEFDAANQILLKHRFGTTRGEIKGAWACVEKDGNKTYAYADLDEYMQKGGTRKDGSRWESPWETYTSIMIKGKALELAAKLVINISGFLSVKSENGEEITIEMGSEMPTISSQQQKKLFALIQERGLKPYLDNVKEYIYKTWKIEHTMDLTIEQAAQVITFLQDGDVEFLKTGEPKIDADEKTKPSQDEAPIQENQPSTVEPSAPQAASHTPEKPDEALKKAYHKLVEFCSEHKIDIKTLTDKTFPGITFGTMSMDVIDTLLAEAKKMKPRKRGVPAVPEQIKPAIEAQTTNPPADSVTQEQLDQIKAIMAEKKQDKEAVGQCVHTRHGITDARQLRKEWADSLIKDLEQDPAWAHNKIPGQTSFVEPSKETQKEYTWSEIYSLCKNFNVSKQELDDLWHEATGKKSEGEVTQEELKGIFALVHQYAQRRVVKQ